MTRQQLISALVTITTAERLRREKASDLGRVKATGCSESVPRYDAPEVSFPQTIKYECDCEICLDPQTAAYSRVEPRQGDLPADCVIPASTLLLWAIVCLAFWLPVALVVVLFTCS